MDQITSQGKYFIRYHHYDEWDKLTQQLEWTVIYFNSPTDLSLKQPSIKQRWQAHQSCALRATQMGEQWIVVADKLFDPELMNKLNEIFIYLLPHWSEWDICTWKSKNSLNRVSELYLIHPSYASKLAHQNYTPNQTINQWFQTSRIIYVDDILSLSATSTSVILNPTELQIIIGIILILLLCGGIIYARK